MIELQDFKHPVNILQQPKSDLVTNPFIKPHTEVISSTTTMKPTNHHNNIASSVIGLLDDLLTKPQDTPWLHYLPQILQKDQRSFHLGFLLILLALLFVLIKV
jgi:hypothetical protein